MGWGGGLSIELRVSYMLRICMLSHKVLVRLYMDPFRTLKCRSEELGQAVGWEE